MQENVSAYVRITGIVQGVFYRVETKRAAESFGLNGFVKNNSDGSVEAVIEGNKEFVDKMVKWCQKGPSHACVEAIDVEWKTYTGKFKTFDIIY